MPHSRNTSGDIKSDIVLEQEKLKKREEIIAFEEAKKRSKNYAEHASKTEESTKYEIERAKWEMKQRNAEKQLVEDEEVNFEKQVLETYKAKAKDEAEKGQKWDKERDLEDLEMQEKIKTRNELLKKKQLDMNQEREDAEIEARNIEATTIAAAKAFQEKNIQEIAIDKMLENELKKKEERMARNEIVVRKKDEADRVRAELEVNALAMQKELRAGVLELQKAELNRFEREIHEGEGIKEREKKKKCVMDHITKDGTGMVDIIGRQKERDFDKERKTQEIANETEMFVAMQADKRKALQHDRKKVEERVKQHDDSLIQEEDMKRAAEKERLVREKQLREKETEKQEAELLNLLVKQKQMRADIASYEYDSSEEERLRLEALKRRKQQQDEIMNQHIKEMALLHENIRDSKKDNQNIGKKKGFFSNLFKKR